MLSFSCWGLEADTNAAAGSAPNGAEANAGSDDSLRAYLQLQEQVHETMLAIERTRQQTEDANARNSKALADRLQSIEKSLAAQQELLSAQRVNELETVQHANRTLLLVVSSFAALGCLAVVLTAYFQWRAVNRFTAVSAAFPGGNSLGSRRAVPALESGDSALPAIATIEQSNARLLGAIERLEKRIQELERGSHSALTDATAASNILDLESAEGTPAAAHAGTGSAGNATLTSQLTRGQSLLNQGKLDEAIACFDEVLAADPQNAEALVKKGTALERLRKPQEALECYDRAIAADGSMTIAYLYKGGLFNRMERFSEALACYEQALHTQEKRRAG